MQWTCVCVCVCGQVYPELSDDSQACLPLSSFFTCSSDNTIRLWQTDVSGSAAAAAQKNLYSNVGSHAHTHCTLCTEMHENTGGAQKHTFCGLLYLIYRLIMNSGLAEDSLRGWEHTTPAKRWGQRRAARGWWETWGSSVGNKSRWTAPGCWRPMWEPAVRNRVVSSERGHRNSFDRRMWFVIKKNIFKNWNIFAYQLIQNIS